MSRNKHSKTRRNQNAVGGVQRTTTAPRKARSQTTSSGAIPSAMTNSSGLQSEALAMVDGARSKVTGLASNALQSIKNHPMQYALAGVGIACAGAGLTWLLVSAAKHATDENGNAVDFPHRLQASMKDVQHSMKGARKSIVSATESALQSGKKIEQSVEDVVREHPIAVGAALLATGAAIALAMPRSALEDTWIGRERDQVVSSAQKLAKGAVEKAQSFAKQMSGSASNGTANAQA